jgi:hypothetical protein
MTGPRIKGVAVTSFSARAYMIRVRMRAAWVRHQAAVLSQAVVLGMSG